MTSAKMVATTAVRRTDGTVDQVVIGTVAQVGDRFEVSLNPFSIAAAGTSLPAPAPRRSSGAAPDVFPPYGKSKGKPIAGASRQDLEFYASGCRRSLADPSKSRWREKEEALLAAIQAELARNSDEGPPPPSDDDALF